MTNITIEKLEALEKSGCLTHELRQELSRLRHANSLEIQLAEAERKALEKAANALKTKVTGTLEPSSKDDVAILSLWSHPHNRLLSDANREVWLSDSSVSFFSKEVFAELEPKLTRIIQNERFPILAIVKNWQANLHSPSALIDARVRPPAPTGVPSWHRQPDEPGGQQLGFIIDRCRSVPILAIWSAESHKAKIMLARHGVPHPPELSGNGWEAIEQFRALKKKEEDALAAERAKLEKRQAAMFESSQKAEKLRAETREAARKAYHAALEQAENATPEPPKRARKTPNQLTEATE